MVDGRNRELELQLDRGESCWFDKRRVKDGKNALAGNVGEDGRVGPQSSQRIEVESLAKNEEINE